MWAAPWPGMPELIMDSENISLDLDRFLRLSAEMMETLSNLSRKVKEAVERLKEDQRLQQERFESLMENQNNRWEEEKRRRVQEDRDYQENLRLRRQREEEEYRQKWAVEQQQAKRMLAEELRALEAENRLKLETLEKEFSHRELILKEKELECSRLVQELEQFISGLSVHAGPRPIVPTNSAGER
jgi:phosphoglycolate phosphatase-like HAD superfamily hydrolase